MTPESWTDKVNHIFRLLVPGVVVAIASRRIAQLDSATTGAIVAASGPLAYAWIRSLARFEGDIYRVTRAVKWLLLSDYSRHLDFIVADYARHRGAESVSNEVSSPTLAAFLLNGCITTREPARDRPPSKEGNGVQSIARRCEVNQPISTSSRRARGRTHVEPPLQRIQARPTRGS